MSTASSNIFDSGSVSSEVLQRLRSDLAMVARGMPAKALRSIAEACHVRRAPFARFKAVRAVLHGVVAYHGPRYYHESPD